MERYIEWMEKVASMTINSGGIDIRKLIEYMDGKITNSDNFLRHGRTLLAKDGNFFEILISGNVTDFDIAEQMGHLILHSGYITPGKDWKDPHEYVSNSTNSTEVEAHCFAMSYMMPKAEFIESCKNNFDGEIYDTDNIAKQFNITRNQASDRGKQLGVFNEKD